MGEQEPPRFPTALVAGNLISLGVGLTVALGKVWLWYRAGRAPASSLLALPSLPVYGTLALALLAAAAVALVALVRRKPAQHRAYRLLPVAFAALLFLHWLVLPPIELPIPADEYALGQLSFLREALSAQPELPREPGEVEKLLGPARPPYLVRGAPAARWKVLLRSGCAGPWLQAPAGVDAGTALVCLSESGREAWITGVGAGGALFGEPAVLARQGRTSVLLAKAGASAEGAREESGGPDAAPGQGGDSR